MRVASAYPLAAVGTGPASNRLPAIADPVLVAPGAGVPPRDPVPPSSDRFRHLQRLVLRHGRHEQLTPRLALRQVVQRRRQEVIVPHVLEGRPEVVDDGEDGPVAPVLWWFSCVVRFHGRNSLMSTQIGVISHVNAVKISRQH